MRRRPNRTARPIAVAVGQPGPRSPCSPRAACSRAAPPSSARGQTRCSGPRSTASARARGQPSVSARRALHAALEPQLPSFVLGGTRPSATDAVGADRANRDTDDLVGLTVWRGWSGTQLLNTGAVASATAAWGYQPRSGCMPPLPSAIAQPRSRIRSEPSPPRLSPATCMSPGTRRRASRR